jgi:hypothetical protein
MEQDRKYLMDNYYGKDFSDLDSNKVSIINSDLNRIGNDYYSRAKRISELTPQIKQKLEKYS